MRLLRPVISFPVQNYACHPVIPLAGEKHGSFIITPSKPTEVLNKKGSVAAATNEQVIEILASIYMTIVTYEYFKDKTYSEVHGDTSGRLLAFVDFKTKVAFQ